jgi:hypothetical protein
MMIKFEELHFLSVQFSFFLWDVKSFKCVAAVWETNESSSKEIAINHFQASWKKICPC